MPSRARANRPSALRMSGPLPSSAPPPPAERARSDGAATPDAAPAAAPAAVSLRHVAWPVLLSLVVLGLIGYFTFEPGSLRRMARSMNPWLLGAAAGMTALQVLFGGWRFRYIARGRLGLRAGVRAQLAWHFFSNVTPSAVGGGPPAALYIARAQGIPAGEATAFMLFAMLLDQLWLILSIPLLFVAAFYVDLFPAAVGTVGTWTFAACFLGLMAWSVFFAYATLVRPDVLERLAGWVFRRPLLRRFRARVMEEMHQLSRRARTLRQQPFGFYAGGFLITAALWMTRYLLVLFVVWSVFPGVDALLVLLRTAALTFSSLVLPTPGGAGGLEGLYALFIGPLLPAQALVAPTLLAWRLLGYYVFIALGAYLFTRHVQQAFRHRRENGNGHAPPPETAEDETESALLHDSPVS